VRYVRTLLVGGGAALLPFLLVATFTWVRDGRAAGAIALLGHGELCPAAAVLAGQALTTNFGAPVPARRARWMAEVSIGWLVLGVSCVTYPVPFAGVVGYERRVAGFSAVVFAVGVAAHVATARWDRQGGAP